MVNEKWRGRGRETSECISNSIRWILKAMYHLYSSHERTRSMPSTIDGGNGTETKQNENRIFHSTRNALPDRTTASSHKTVNELWSSVMRDNYESRSIFSTFFVHHEPSDSDELHSEHKEQNGKNWRRKCNYKVERMKPRKWIKWNRRKKKCN